jgi:hypothetical protein
MLLIVFQFGDSLIRGGMQRRSFSNPLALDWGRKTCSQLPWSGEAGDLKGELNIDSSMLLSDEP